MASSASFIATAGCGTCRCATALEHNFGHGKQNLAAILVSLNLLAFAMHAVCDIGDELWRNARTKLGPRCNFFSKLAAITTYLIFPSWVDLPHARFCQAAANPAMSAAPP